MLRGSRGRKKRNQKKRGGNAKMQMRRNTSGLQQRATEPGVVMRYKSPTKAMMCGYQSGAKQEEIKCRYLMLRKKARYFIVMSRGLGCAWVKLGVSPLVVRLMRIRRRRRPSPARPCAAPAPWFRGRSRRRWAGASVSTCATPGCAGPCRRPPGPCRGRPPP